MIALRAADLISNYFLWPQIEIKCLQHFYVALDWILHFTFHISHFAIENIANIGKCVINQLENRWSFQLKNKQTETKQKPLNCWNLIKFDRTINWSGNNCKTISKKQINVIKWNAKCKTPHLCVWCTTCSSHRVCTFLYEYDMYCIAYTVYSIQYTYNICKILGNDFIPWLWRLQIIHIF